MLGSVAVAVAAVEVVVAALHYELSVMGSVELFTTNKMLTL